MAGPVQCIREDLLTAIDTLRTHKFRSFLTLLGVLIGTTTVIAVTSIIAGLDKQLVDVAQQFGTRTLWVYKLQVGAPRRLTREERLRKPLSYEDAMAIRDRSPSTEAVSVELLREMTDYGLAPVTARYKGHDMIDALFAGVTPDHMRLINATIADGRFFTDTEDVHRRDVAVIGDGVRERFFANGNALGKTILVDGRSLEIIGVLTKFKSFLGDNQDDRAILIPYHSFKKMYPEAQDNFICVLAWPGKMDQAKDEVTEILRRRRHVAPSQADNFGISSAESVITQFREIISTVALVMVVISSIGLLVGGIGVMNIMLVSVTERTREIGVRKAVGARRRDITWQFLAEAMTLTSLGGLIGILAGWLLSVGVRTFVPSLPSTVPLWSVIAGFSVATSVGLFFGMWPAVKAARLDPIAALRYE
ncbi:MAG TPA: ABC transporter permease [Bryobacteraceae bacterium]|jgi:ABC-type antimicrobial peptide transport system permease subunit